MPIELAATIPLVDHHCHGVVPTALDDAGFEALISESYGKPPRGTNNFQSPLGLILRRFCPEVMDLPKLASREAYLERRAALGPEEVNRRFLRACGLSDLVVDTGHRSDHIATHEAMGAIAGQAAHEVVRIEAVAERVARSGVTADGYPEAVGAALIEAARGAVGLKTIVAYRATFAIDQTPPRREEVVTAAGAWLKRIAATGKARIEDPVLLRHGLWLGAELCRQRGFPLQVHVGFGDTDITMHACDPTHFTAFFKATEPWGIPITLLHCYPFQREAGWLAEVFPHVYFDVGCVLNYTGPSSADVLGEALEMAPFTKQLYSSDAFGLPELYYLGAVLFRRALARTLDRWIADDLCGTADAEEIVRLIARENALRIYSLA